MRPLIIVRRPVHGYFFRPARMTAASATLVTSQSCSLDTRHQMLDIDLKAQAHNRLQEGYESCDPLNRCLDKDLSSTMLELVHRKLGQAASLELFRASQQLRKCI
jgi:hypothetical protein